MDPHNQTVMEGFHMVSSLLPFPTLCPNQTLEGAVLYRACIWSNVHSLMHQLWYYVTFGTRCNRCLYIQWLIGILVYLNIFVYLWISLFTYLYIYTYFYICIYIHLHIYPHKSLDISIYLDCLLQNNISSKNVFDDQSSRG